MALYHVAEPVHRASIAEHGLDHRRETTPNWRAGVLALYHHYPRGNYLWAKLEIAEAYAGEEWDVWAVEADGLDLVDDPCRAEESLYEHAFYACEPVAPERLTLLKAADALAQTAA